MAAVGPCPLCGRQGAAVLFRVADRLHGTPGEFTYRKCVECGTVFQDPRVVPEDLILCYPDEYYTRSGPTSAVTVVPRFNEARPETGWRRLTGPIGRAVKAAAQGAPRSGLTGLLGRVLALNPRFREWAFRDYTTDDKLPHYVGDELLPRSPSGRRALEIGCGRGNLLVSLGAVGWEAEGVEWDAAAARIARQVTGRPVRQGDFRQVDLPRGAYDLVVLHHVFEHLDNPLQALACIRDLLIPGGRAVLYYPNPQALGAKLFGDAWYPWEVPRHLVLPPGRALARAAKTVGLVPVKLKTAPGEAVYCFALSREYREGKRVDLTRCEVHFRDRLGAAVERALLAVGPFPVGEEVLLVLEKPARSPERGDG